MKLLSAAIVFENVPSFGTSLAGQLIVTHLERLGYHVFTTLLKPNEEWNEIDDRKRWILVATLDRPFTLQVPGTPSTTPFSAYLDSPDPERDDADAQRIAATITGLRRQQERHRALGHGFGFSGLTGSETRLPVNRRSYHKINTGPFVATPHGPRILRLRELERLLGRSARGISESLGIEILGQGVSRALRRILHQIGSNPAPIRPPAAECQPVDKS